VQIIWQGAVSCPSKHIQVAIKCHHGVTIATCRWWRCAAQYVLRWYPRPTEASIYRTYKHPCKWKNKDIQEISSNIMLQVQKQNNKIKICFFKTKIHHKQNLQKSGRDWTEHFVLTWARIMIDHHQLLPY
jgi:hypothetical protein